MTKKKLLSGRTGTWTHDKKADKWWNWDLNPISQGFFLTLSPILGIDCMCSVAQLCPTICDPIDCSPPGSFVHGNFQARILEWVAISFSNFRTRKSSNSSHFLSSFNSLSVPKKSVQPDKVKQTDTPTKHIPDEVKTLKAAYIFPNFQVKKYWKSILLWKAWILEVGRLLLLLLSHFSRVQLCATP